MQPITQQDQIDWKKPKPEEHLAWAMQNMPTFAGTGAVTHSGFLKKWSEHLVKTGCVHVDYLRTLADADGNIHVSKLPKQSIKFQEAFRGPHHQYNNASRWVEAGTPVPEPMRLQDVTKLTLQEQYVMAEQLRQVGVVSREQVRHHVAEELNEGL